MAYVKFEPNLYVFVIKKGKVVREGQGLSLWFFAPTTSLISIPTETANVPFIFEETSGDFQTLTVQGELIYRIADPRKIRSQVNFGISTRTLRYLSEDPAKLEQRIINIVKTASSSEVAEMSMRDAISSVDGIASRLRERVQSNEYLEALGITITNVDILAISPSKETSRALEAETRENILREADDAVYKRRNSAVEQERKIKENELNTDLAVEEKQRQIMEAKIEGQRVRKEKERQIEEEELAFKIRQEHENTKLIELSVKNRKTEADIRAYALKAVIDSFEKADPEVVKALASMGMETDQLIANAFGGIASRADKIGELNISPELLQKLMKP
jgi:regulator of protease activity HflC (stomatin/prohibitin superfamily)